MRSQSAEGLVLEAHPRMHLHFTPTCSWLNHVELRFAKIDHRHPR
jgi:hypothetical protein